MTPLLPNHALPFFGPDPVGDWGGVPWGTAYFRTPAGLRAGNRLWRDAMALFRTPGTALKPRAILLTANIDDDNDGPGGSKEVDPCWQGETSLRWPDGSSIDSRTFRGMVMHRIVQEQGGGLGDIGVSCWGGQVHFCQYYDEGPTNKAQEGSEAFLRLFSVIEPGQSSRHAAVVGNDVQDFCSIIFPGSAPRDAHGRPYALPTAEIIARGWQLWNAFTGRPA